MLHAAGFSLLAIWRIQHSGMFFPGAASILASKKCLIRHKFTDIVYAPAPRNRKDFIRGGASQNHLLRSYGSIMKHTLAILAALIALSAATFTIAQTAPAARTGKQVYDAACVMCHASGAAGAPKFGDAVAWKPRIAQGDAAMLQHVTKGYKAMPPRGTCTKCSDAELKAAIDYMVAKAQEKK
jgi:cytochrome c5